MSESLSRAVAEVDLERIARNFQRLRARAGAGNAVAVVVKADAYGHGLLPVARTCAAAGASHFAVATLDEAVTLREAGLSQNVMVLPAMAGDEAPVAVRHGIVSFVSDPAFADALCAAVAAGAADRAACFVVLDTGMGREGMTPAQLRRFLARVPDHVEILGLSTHLSSADEDDPTPTLEQCAAFDAFVAELGPRADGLWRSVANSPGMLRAPLPASGPILFRPGALLYGIEPYPGALEGTDLEPALTWRARVTLIRELPAGTTVGYGRTATLSQPARIATIASGYADGLSRRLSNVGTVLVRGVRCPLVGRVSMDQCQADVTALAEVRVGDWATLLGRDGDAEVTAAQMADAGSMTCHEPTTTLSKRVPRVYGS